MYGVSKLVSFCSWAMEMTNVTINVNKCNVKKNKMTTNKAIGDTNVINAVMINKIIAKAFIDSYCVNQ